MIRIKRIYDTPAKEDGYRILVDRLWPRGLKKNTAKIDLWLKDIAPSGELRKSFSHDVSKWPEFRRKYSGELKDNAALVDKIRALKKENKNVTLLFSAKDVSHNNATVLRDYTKKTR